jgi:oligoribonuclease NrnB/cAMP/cGMP phosphodiesterase (DHH superfamily)
VILKQILRNSKILSISHLDLDGAVCQIILGQVFNNIEYLSTSFYKMDSILKEINYNWYDHVILTDIHPDDYELLKISPKIILLDHHESALSVNNPSLMHYVIPGKCAAVLTKKFIEKYYNIKLSHLDELVKLTNDYDMWELKYPKSKQLNDLMFYKYRSKKFRDLFFNGRTEFTEEEIQWLKQRETDFEVRFNELNIYECEKINGCIVQSEEFINEICDRIMNEKKYEIVFCRNPFNGRVSIRHRIKNLNMGKILSDHKWGGGHQDSCGLFVENLADFEDKVRQLENIISEFLSTQG